MIGLHMPDPLACPSGFMTDRASATLGVIDHAHRAWLWPAPLNGALKPD
jgi:hypothetical protein